MLLNTTAALLRVSAVVFTYQYSFEGRPTRAQFIRTHLMSSSSSSKRFNDLLEFFKNKDAAILSPIEPPDQTKKWMSEFDRKSFRQAAVLIPVTKANNVGESSIVLTVRSSNLKSHAGQVSLPGGTSEEQDRDLTATALRESYEEIGLRPEGVEILGQLGELVMPSGYRVTPVVGIIENDLDYVANPAEVDSIFLAPLSLVLDTEAYMRSTVTYRDIERTVLELHHGDHRIWGATAAILYHLAKHA